jgi:hypothetical protein
MWDSAFLSPQQRVTDALLRRPVLPNGGKAFEKVSAAMAVRTALLARPSAEHTLMFLVPEATASTARHIAAALLVGNHVHANGSGELPPAEVRPLFKGDVLLVTPAVSECKAELDEVPIGSYYRLKDYWEVIPLSKYTKPKGDKPRVCLANPGWMLAGVAGRRFGAVIIDASHPRTYTRLPDLLRMARGCSSLRLAVSPPMPDPALHACGYPGKTDIWVWDPQAMTDAQAIVDREDAEPHELGERFLWVCEDDEAAAALANLHRQLVAAMQGAAGRPYPGLQLCWSLYNRLRQLTVPLAQLEQAAANSWSGSLRERIEALDEIHGHGDVAWDTTWPGLVDAVKMAYQTLAKLQETAKFWAVAAKVEAFVVSGEPRLRIVVASEKESELLTQALLQVADGAGRAMAEGRLEVVTGAGEARLVAEGQRSPAVLLGPRTNGYRHLDVFPSRRVDEFVYPHEVAVERASQARMYGSWMQALSDERRIKLLEPLGLKPLARAKASTPSPRPRIYVGGSRSQAAEAATEADVSSSLDLDSLTAGLDWGGIDEESLQLNYGMPAQAGDSVEVTFTRGRVERYYASQNVDVFFSESEQVQRHPAAALRPGWRVIGFVDGSYDGLFKRLTEVANARLPAQARVALELWRAAKEGLFATCSNKTVLYERLRRRGLVSTYEAFMSWFDDEGTLAPLQYREFEVVANECETYRKAPELLKATFEAVRHVRGRNRGAGKVLRRFLRAVVSGEGYDDALAGARKLDAQWADVLAAVDVFEVDSVRVIQRSR